MKKRAHAKDLLVVIDVQYGLDDPQYGRRNNPDAETQIGALLSAWRRAKKPVAFSRYVSKRAKSPLASGKPGNAIKHVVAPWPGETIFTKSGNSLLKNSQFRRHLRRLGARELILVGLTTDACISATAREAKDLGFHVTIVSDACATFDRRTSGGLLLAAKLVHETELGILDAAGVRITTTAELVAQISHRKSGARPRT